MKLWVIDISGIYKLQSKNPEFQRNPEKFHPCFLYAVVSHETF